MKAKEIARHVFRDKIEQEREDYTVTYQPADARSPVAQATLVIPEVPEELDAVAKVMEAELEHWLKRFPVPVRISPVTEKGELLPLSTSPSECHLMGYVRLWDESVVRRWGGFSDRELPEEQVAPAYLAKAYSSLPFRLLEEEREKKSREFRSKILAIGGALLLLAGAPLLLQAILLWEQPLAIVLSAVCIGLGGYRVAQLMGWRKPTGWQVRKKERGERMAHYFFHCERNPDAFAELAKENFDQEVAEEDARVERQRKKASRGGGRGTTPSVLGRLPSVRAART